MNYERTNLPALAERLTAARKAAKLTQEAAAKHLGMSRPTFIAIEKGTRRPHPDELVKLSELYGEPLNKLLRPNRPSPDLRPHLRSIPDAEGGQQGLEAAITLLYDYIDDYKELERLAGARPVADFPSPVSIPVGSMERFAEHCAQEERARLSLGAHRPVHTLRTVLEDAGVHVFVDRLDSKLSGLYAFVPDFGYCILINRFHPPERRRWTIAHEYGHFLADRDRPGVDYLHPMQRKPRHERFADAFAAAFLMPEPGVQRRFYEDIDRTGDFKVADLCRMADYFAVSLMAMSLRLESLGLIARGSWDQISASRVPVNSLKREAGIEPSRNLEPDEPYPRRYMLLAVQAFVDESITEGQLARFLRCPRIRARQIVEDCLEATDGDDDGSKLAPGCLTHSLLTGTG